MRMHNLEVVFIFITPNSMDLLGLKNTQFSNYTGFFGVEFIGSARFHYAIFSGKAFFDQSIFKASVDFSDTNFKNKISFLAIEGNSFFSFKDTRFFFVPDFNQAHFKEAPQFDISSFYKANSNNQSDTNDINHISSKWRSLKRLAIQAHDHKSELSFFAEELKSQRGIQDKALPNPLNSFTKEPVWQGGTRYWLGYFYQYLSDFGRSVMWPFFWLLILGLLFYIFFLKYTIEDKPTPTHNDPVTQVTVSCDRSEAAIYLSVRNSLPFLPISSFQKKQIEPMTVSMEKTVMKKQTYQLWWYSLVLFRQYFQQYSFFYYY